MIPDILVDSEFFGHERGAFSGAISQRKGHFEVANGGTLFLDEIGEMPMSLQARLLRVLQEGEVVRVGSSKPVPVNVRVVAATNKNLKALIDDGEFRTDLYYRIAAAIVHIPPLRERPSDIMMLARAFIEKCTPPKSTGLRIQAFAAHILRSYSWPGNVREPRGVIQVAFAKAVAGGRKSMGAIDLRSDALCVLSWRCSRVGHPNTEQVQTDGIDRLSQNRYRFHLPYVRKSLDSDLYLV